MSAALYIHVPFCRHKCIYCDFYSTTDLFHIDKYVNAVLTEIDFWSTDDFFQQQQFSTLYFGGGTPSLLSPEHLSAILQHLFSAFDFFNDAEITLEANPGAILQEKLSAYRSAGVNRLTLGIQSFQDDELRFLTRIHSAQEAQAAFKAARQAGFDNIGVDLIFGLPGQTLETWEKNCRRALELEPEHISMYGLTFEEHTPLWRQLQKGHIQKCDEEVERDMFIRGIDALKHAGYEQYEISNFARPGYSSKHNQKYWDASPFLSLGPSAHSYNGEKRWWNVSDTNLYINKVKRNTLPIENEEILSAAEKKQEFVLLGLRRKGGVNLSEWQRLTNRTQHDILLVVEHMFGELDTIRGFEPSRRKRALTVNENHLCLTQQGLLLYNSICENICAL